MKVPSLCLIFLLYFCTALNADSVITKFSLPEASQPFIVYDAIRIKNKPNLSLYGLQRLPIAYEGNLWPGGSSKKQPDFTRARKFFSTLPKDTKLLCLDIETWPLSNISNSALEMNISKIVSIIKLAREILPNTKIGLYGIIPIRDYWSPVGNRLLRTARMEKWKTQNNKLMPLAKHLDVIFPSLYTFEDNIERWKKYALANINQAKIYGKPIYPFIWPQYHKKQADKTHKFISATFWRAQLEFIQAHAPAVVIWSKWSNQPAWNENAPWWEETKHFVKKNTLATKLF